MRVINATRGRNLQRSIINRVKSASPFIVRKRINRFNTAASMELMLY